MEINKNNIKFTTLDGSLDEQIKTSEAFIDLLTDEERERSMSSEFDYLDEN